MKDKVGNELSIESIAAMWVRIMLGQIKANSDKRNDYISTDEEVESRPFNSKNI